MIFAKNVIQSKTRGVVRKLAIYLKPAMPNASMIYAKNVIQSRTRGVVRKHFIYVKPAMPNASNDICQ